MAVTDASAEEPWRCDNHAQCVCPFPCRAQHAAPDPITAILAVECPDCPATPGKFCGFDPDYRDYLHASRIRKALTP